MNRKDRRAQSARARQSDTMGASYSFGGALPESITNSEPEPPELRWLEQNKDGVFIAANLDVGARYLADSPDAFELLAWLDDATGRQLSLNMAAWALRLVGQIPMPKEGS